MLNYLLIGFVILGIVGSVFFFGKVVSFKGKKSKEEKEREKEIRK